MLWLYIILVLMGAAWLYHVMKPHPLAGIPGPKRVPIFGNLFQLKSSHLYLQFTEWSREYGPVFGLDLAGQLAVVVSGKEALLEVLVSRGKDFAGRLQTFRTQQFPYFVGLNDLTPIMKHEKKMMMTHLKGYGSGFEQIETIVMKEMEHLCNTLKHACQGGESILSLDSYIEDCVVQISCISVMGRDTDEQEKTKLMNIMNNFNSILKIGFLGQMLDTFPWLKNFGHPYWKMITDNLREVDEAYTEWKHTLDQDKEQGKDVNASFLHKYLEVMEGENELGIEEDNCKNSVMAMFGGAVHNTTITLNALFANLILHPNVQEKLQRESDAVLSGSAVTVKDRFQMPYHHATILEISRLLPILPMAIPHKAACDTKISGYNIPKGTVIFPNIWALHHDENIWDQPLDFNPDRYLDDEGKLVPVHHSARINHLAFGAGPRVCPGETMATARMFLILATLIQNFEFLPASSIDEQPPCGCMDMVDGFAISPPQYSARLKPRNEK